VNVAEPLIDPAAAQLHPLRVAVVTETYPPEVNGVAMTMGKMVEGLLRLQHRIQLIRPRQRPDDVATSNGQIDEVPVRGVPIPLYRDLRLGLPAAKEIIKLWSNERPDIVHVATEGPLGWSALKAGRQLNLPCCADFHTNFHSYSAHYGLGLMKRPIARYLKGFHNQADCTMVPTEDMLSELAATGYRRLRVVSRGVDTKLFSPSRRDPALRASWGVGQEHPVVVYVGRLAPEKNLQLVFDVYDAMRVRSPRARLGLVGDGPQRASYQKRYPEHIFVGMRVGEDLATHYASGDIFLFPSLTETYGNVTTEAMASGLAVVAYNYAAAKQHIQDGATGILVPPKNRAAFIDRACQLIEDPQAIAAYGAKARATVERLDWADVVYVLDNAYREVIAERLAQDAKLNG
jgi:glycosyltransferase involved in cell wall biosynthesis